MSIDKTFSAAFLSGLGLYYIKSLFQSPLIILANLVCMALMITAIFLYYKNKAFFKANRIYPFVCGLAAYFVLASTYELFKLL